MLIVSEFLKPSDTIDNPLLRDERLWAASLDEMRFNALLQTVEAICLREPSRHDDFTEPESHEASVISVLGVRGLKHALEMQTEAKYNRLPADCTTVSPLHRPELFNGPLSRELLAKATAFGSALLDESFEVLGTDAGDWISEFQSAENDEEQIDVLEKLELRLRELGLESRGLIDTEEDGMFHPLRLSPKIIGTYPDHTMSPTCLGVAAIGAGFLKKAGATFLHAGVMEGSWHHEDLKTVGLIRNVHEMCETLDTVLSEKVEERLEAKIAEIASSMGHDTGTHSALLLRLASGSWYQFDSNLKLSTIIPVEYDKQNEIVGECKKLDEVYKSLADFRDIAPGLEIGVSFPRWSNQDTWPFYLKNLGSVDSAAVESALDSASDSVIENIRRCLVDDYLLAEVDDFPNDIVRNYFLKNYYRVLDNGEEELTVDIVTRELIASFVLHDTPVEEWKQRIDADDTFRREAIEDIRRLPALIGIMFSLRLADRDSNRLHSKMELGLPETSIGLSVLHNFGLVLADDLSADHWLSQWSSNIIPPDNLHKISDSPLQERVISANVSHLVSKRGFAFVHTYVKMFLSEMDSIHAPVNVHDTGEV